MALDPRIRKSRQQEKRGATLHGGTQNSGSGNTPWRKNDVRVDDEYLIEYKRTDKRSIVLQGADLENVRINALLEHRQPAMGIEILDRDWTLIPTAEFERLRRAASAGGIELVPGEVPGRPGLHVPPDGAQPQATTRGSQTHLSRARRPGILPGAGGVS